MQNAHLRLGLLEYHRMTEKTSTRIRLRVDRYVGEDEQAHLISVFGNDSDVGAITAAVHEKATFTLTFPDGEVKEVSLGEHASCYKGAVSLPDRKHPVRHLVAVSEATVHQRWRGADDSAGIPARSGVGYAGELSRTPCRTVVGRARSRRRRGGRTHQATRRHRLPAGADLGDDRGSA